VKATALKFAPDASLRLSAEQRLRAVPPAGKSPSVKDLRSAVAELHIYEAELEIQNEELLDSRAQIEESQKKYFRHFDLAPVGLIRLNHAGLILEANILGAQMLDVDRALLHSGPRPFLAHVAPNALAVFEQHLESARSSGKMEMCELRLRGATGHETFVRMQSVISRSEQDETDFYITLTDLTERREIEQKLALQKVVADAAVAAKELFFGMLSHELRTPLNAVIGFTGTLLMGLPGPLTAEQKRQLETVRSSARHQLSLINDLLDLAKIESGKVELNFEQVDCAGVVNEVADTLRPLAKQKGLRYEVRVPKNIVVKIDRRAFSQILINLVNNAIKFTNEGGIRIDVQKKNGATKLSVIDTGIGITREDQARLFDAFARLDSASANREEGSGLGLHLSQKLAALLGVRINFKSKRGQGSSFTLLLQDQPS
jgi:signal transduction histidine kinase